MSAPYIINFTDPDVTGFVVYPNQINGLQLPGSNQLFNDPNVGAAVIANTSLVFLGHGQFNYGDIVQNNVLYLMENFANRSRPINPVRGQHWYKKVDYVDTSYPLDPTTAGMYVWNGSAWDTTLLITSSPTISFQGRRLTNIADAMLPTDALNLQVADAKYVPFIGNSTIQGILTIPLASSLVVNGTLLVSQLPTQPTHATNKQYVDEADASLVSTYITPIQQSIVDLTALLNQSVLDLTQLVNDQSQTYVNKVSGDTMVGNLQFADTSSLIFQPSVTSSIQFGSRRLQQVGDPFEDGDGTNKLYVDTAIEQALESYVPPDPGTGPDPTGLPTAIDFDPSTGLITITRDSTTSISTLSPAAPQIHTHTGSAIAVDISGSARNSLLTTQLIEDPAYPNIPLPILISLLDNAANTQSQRYLRHVSVADGVSGVFTLPTWMEYQVGNNRLQVHADGVKMYANEVGRSSFYFQFTTSQPSLTSPLEVVTDGIYSFNIDVDGAGNQQVDIELSTTSTFYDMVILIAEQFDLLSLPVTIGVRSTASYIALDIVATATTGTGSSVVVTGTGTSLLDLDTLVDVVNTSVTQTLDFSEDGDYGEPSTQITFTSTPLAGTIIEWLIVPV